MITRFDEPVRSTNFGETYGAFLVHCGLSGLGAPSRDDTHAHHGELPNAAYDKASLCFGDDWVTVTGDCRIRVSHSTDVSFSPSLTVHSSGTQLEMSVSITNHRRLPFGYSYLCHVNWPIFDGGRLVQTASLDSRHFELVPHQAQDDATTRYTSAIHHDPATGNQMDLGQPIVPEYCAIVRPHSDEAGEAHFAMTRPDGAAATVSFPVDDLPYAIRWISNTGDEQAAGFCLPSTAHHLGRAAAERDGLIRYVPGGENVTISLKFGLLTGAEAAAMVDVIESASSNYSE